MDWRGPEVSVEGFGTSYSTSRRLSSPFLCSGPRGGLHRDDESKDMSNSRDRRNSSGSDIRDRRRTRGEKRMRSAHDGRCRTGG